MYDVRGSRNASELRWILLTGILILIIIIIMPGKGFARELVLVTDPTLLSAASTTPAPLSAAPTTPTPDTAEWETRAHRSYGIPGLEVIGFVALLNQLDRHFVDSYVYGTDFSTFRNNLTGGKWVVDRDPFAINQFMHPYQGSIFHGFARSAGLNFWESFGYAFAGSFLWKMGGEIGPPSLNDQITTPLAGSFLGEPLFRMSNLLLEGGNGRPGLWRELGAAAISPSTGFNRLVFGNRFAALYPSRHPAVFTRVELGGSLTSQLTDQSVSQSVKREEATADFTMAYGLPGKPDYPYTRPFDYFNFQFTAATANVFENIMTRGLLIGTDYAVGDAYRGVWGLYGSYDYIAPQVFRISTSALSLGTTAQWWLSQAVALQGSALSGVGYGAAGTIQGSGERDYHYGVTPQGLLALSMIFGNVANFDITGREYYVSGVGSTEDHGAEAIFRGDAAFTVRVYGHHGITLKYIASSRDAHYPDLTDRHQTVGTVSLAYTFLSDTKFGAVEWRTVDAGGR
ncbi:MAG: DUF3943 domain-containing protein [Nitrospiria bacterium]